MLVYIHYGLTAQIGTLLFTAFYSWLIFKTIFK